MAVPPDGERGRGVPCLLPATGLMRGSHLLLSAAPDEVPVGREGALGCAPLEHAAADHPPGGNEVREAEGERSF